MKIDSMPTSEPARPDYRLVPQGALLLLAPRVMDQKLHRKLTRHVYFLNGGLFRPELPRLGN